MKKIITLTLSLSISLSFVRADYWTQKAMYPGDGKLRPFSFTIGSNAYVGCGDGNLGLSDDFWEYNPANNTWTQKADFGGGIRWSGVSFSVGNSGFAGLGWSNSQMMSDMWKFDAAANTWTQLNNFPIGQRQIPAGFTLDAKAYIGTGRNSNNVFQNDFWEYNPVSDSWTQMANVPGVLRSNALGFSVNGAGYIGGGVDPNVITVSDIYKYNPVTNSWSPIANIPGSTRGDAAAFAINNFGYVGTGQVLPPFNTVLNDFWQYNSVSGQWIQKAVYGGTARDESAFCSVGNRGYIGLGGLNGNANYNDWWEYTPDSTVGISDIEIQNMDFNIYPNPVKDFVVISSEFRENKKVEISITDAQGKKAFGKQLQTKTLNFKLQTSNFSKGIYFVEVSDGKEKAVKKFLKE